MTYEIVTLQEKVVAGLYAKFVISCNMDTVVVEIERAWRQVNDRKIRKPNLSSSALHFTAD